MAESRHVLFLVVGGPSGVGKSTIFPRVAVGIDSFNVDDYCATLNNGSYQNLTPELRARGLEACDEFVRAHFHDRVSVAIEASLRRDITFQQVHAAKSAGFTTVLVFLGNDDVEENVRRVKARAREGWHAARPEVLRDIYRESMANLPKALREFDSVDVYDNTEHANMGREPRLVLQAERGAVTYVGSNVPQWLRHALRGTEYERP